MSSSSLADFTSKNQPLLIVLVIMGTFILCCMICTGAAMSPFGNTSTMETEESSDRVESEEEPESVVSEEGDSSEVDTEPEAKAEPELTLDGLIPHDLIDINDTSVAGCKRLEYKVLVPDDTANEDLAPFLEFMYQERKGMSDKVFIFVYNESDEAKLDVMPVFYRARLSMNASCDQSNEYTINVRE